MTCRSLVALRTGPSRQLFTIPHPPDSPAQLSTVSARDGQRFIFAVNVQPVR
jgi:hypothetical protein